MDQSPNKNQTETKRVQLDNVATQPSTSSASVALGGGGADSSHGLVFHLAIAMLLLFSLKEMNQADPGFQYHIWLEKQGYGKFDDIVLRYKKSEGNWIEICIQCEHGEEKIAEDEKKVVNNVTANHLFAKKGPFSLVEYIKSFVDIREKSVDCDSYYVILTNRVYVEDKDSEFPFFQRENIVSAIDVKSLLFLDNNCFKIKYNKGISNFILKQNGVHCDESVLEEFCLKFSYICDSRDLEVELKAKLEKHCNNNKENAKNLNARLYYLVSQMYQHKIDPTQIDLNNEFSGKNIFYKIPHACPQFTGRVKEIEQIKQALKCDKKGTIFDLLVTGMAGMGKTQIVRKYVEENKKYYKNVIWINAETKKSLKTSFCELAKLCQLIQDDCKDEISTIVHTVYSYFRELALFVFDNTQKVLLSQNQANEYIYLPQNEPKTKNRFIVISQDQKWTTNYPCVTVDKFTGEDALIYLGNSLECPDEDKLKLACMYQYWPLALCLAVSYIKLETENSLGRKSCSDVIKTLEMDTEKLLEHLPSDHEMEPYEKSLPSLWKLIQKKLRLENKLSLITINIFSFSEPDNFPVELLKFDGLSEDVVNISVRLLINFSLVTLSDYKISIHRTLQSVIRNEILKDINEYKSVLLRGIECFSNYLKSLDSIQKKKSLGNNHMVAFQNHLCDSQIEPQKYLTMGNELLDRLIDSEDLLHHGGCNGIFERMLHISTEKLGDKHLETLRTLNMNATVLLRTGKYNDALQYFNNLIKVYTEMLGEKDHKTLSAMNNKADVLYHMAKYNEALGIYDHVFELSPNALEEPNTEILTASMGKASVLEGLGRYDDALHIHNEIIEILTKTYDKNDTRHFTSMHDKASVLIQMGKHEEALGILTHVIENRAKLFGDDHPSNLSSMNSKASILIELRRYDEAHCIYKHVHSLTIKLLGDKHPGTLSSLNNIASLLSKVGQHKQAVYIFNHVIKTLSEMVGENHPNIIVSLNNKASALLKMKEYENALGIFDRLIEMTTELLGREHPYTIRCIHNKAFVLIDMERYEETLSILTYIIEVKTKLFGENHPHTILSINNKAKLINILQELT